MDRMGLIEQLARVMRPGLFHTMPDEVIGPATQMNRDETRRYAQRVVESELIVPAYKVEKLRARVKELEEIIGNLEAENRTLSASVPRRFPGD